MSYLVDTNVISAGAPSRGGASTTLADWMDANSDKLFVSVVTIAEIQQGIAKSRREGAARKADVLDVWLKTLLHLYGARVLPLDIEIARLAGELADRCRALGRPPGFADIVIGATAIGHRLTLLTRNLKHFEPMGVALQDPFLTLPA